MMLRKKSSNCATLRALYLLPLAALAVAACSRTVRVPVTDPEIEQVQTVTANTTRVVIVDGKEYTGDLKDIPSDKVETVTVNKDGDGAGVITIVTTDKSTDNGGRVSITSNTSGRILNIRGKEAAAASDNTTRVVIVDGKEYTGDLKDIPSDKVESVTVNKDGDGAGVITIVTTDKNTDNGGRVSITSNTSGRILNIRSKEAAAASDNTTRVVIVDGKEYTGDLKDIPSDKVESVTVNKDGDGAGVITIVTKGGAADK